MRQLALLEADIGALLLSMYWKQPVISGRSRWWRWARLSSGVTALMVVLVVMLTCKGDGARVYF